MTFEEKFRGPVELVEKMANLPIPEGTCSNSDQEEGFHDGVCCCYNFLMKGIAALDGETKVQEGSMARPLTKEEIQMARDTYMVEYETDRWLDTIDKLLAEARLAESEWWMSMICKPDRTIFGNARLATNRAACQPSAGAGKAK